MKVAIIEFPGASGSQEVLVALEAGGFEAVDCLSSEVTDLSAYSLIVLGGGASYGDYYRPGALAALEPVGAAIKAASQNPDQQIIGLGNGCQILCELGVLPGGFLINPSLTYECRSRTVRIKASDHPFLQDLDQETYQWPQACKYGTYACGDQTIDQLYESGQVWLTYQDTASRTWEAVAGLMNETGNVLGMMVRPERACLSHHPSQAALTFFLSMNQGLRRG